MMKLSLETVAKRPSGDRKPSIKSDLKAAVEKKFFDSTHTDLRRVVAFVEPNGAVTLRGQVRSFYLRQIAFQLAASVDGIERVHDEIMVSNLRVERFQNSLASE